MNPYAKALEAFLSSGGIRQEDFATKIKKPQPTVNRYAKGRRFPDSETAREIERASDGAVPFALWQGVAMERMGIAA